MKSKFYNYESLVKWVILISFTLFLIALVSSCQDPYDKFEDVHMSYFVTQSWVSTDSAFSVSFQAPDSAILSEDGTEHRLTYYCDKNVLFIGPDFHYKITGGLWKDGYFITNHLGKRYEVINVNSPH